MWGTMAQVSRRLMMACSCLFLSTACNRISLDDPRATGVVILINPGAIVVRIAAEPLDCIELGALEVTVNGISADETFLGGTAEWEGVEHCAGPRAQISYADLLRDPTEQPEMDTIRIESGSVKWVVRVPDLFARRKFLQALPSEVEPGGTVQLVWSVPTDTFWPNAYLFLLRDGKSLAKIGSGHVDVISPAGLSFTMPEIEPGPVEVMVVGGGRFLVAECDGPPECTTLMDENDGPGIVTLQVTP